MPAIYADHRAQLKAILCGWGMPEDNAEITAEVLAWSDLHGVDSHGISMIPGYDVLRRNGRVRMDARPEIVSQTPVSAVVDGGGGLGHVPGHFAMSTVIAKAKAVGMAAAVVRRSAHYGAAGFYTLMAANAGLIGISTTSASGIQVAPTFGKQARLGTDPWSFAAPSADGVPFLLDMATTTVAAVASATRPTKVSRRPMAGCSIATVVRQTIRWWRRTRADSSPRSAVRRRIRATRAIALR
jgi:LDH2 family malate/lactate/ureidoglycolate dehydrogenase